MQCARLGFPAYYQRRSRRQRGALKGADTAGTEPFGYRYFDRRTGPTTDDLTKETAAQLMGKGLVMDMHSLERVEAYFKARRIEMTENNKKQALCPEGAWCSTTITVQHRD